MAKRKENLRKGKTASTEHKIYLISNHILRCTPITGKGAPGSQGCCRCHGFLSEVGISYLAAIFC